MNKKIGILTFHRAYNYGAVLQCYALQEVLKGLGHDVYVIDYRQPWTEEVYKIFSLSIAFKYCSPIYTLRYFVNLLNRYKCFSIRKKIFRSFIDKHLQQTPPCITDIPQNFDYYIIGSDQLWGLNCLGGKPDMVYWGNFKHPSKSKIVGYAISTNTKSLNLLGINFINRYIQNFSALSVRENNISKELKEITRKDIPVCCDPTLLTDKTLWNSLINRKWEKRKYILMYQVRYNDRNLLKKKAYNLANQFDCEVIDLSEMTYKVEDFVSLFKYATYVVTTSFHATVFSIIFEKPFYAIRLNDGHDGRYENILNILGLGQCCVDMDAKLTCQPIDYVQVRQNLSLYRETSIEFLKQI